MRFAQTRFPIPHAVLLIRVVPCIPCWAIAPRSSHSTTSTIWLNKETQSCQILTPATDRCLALSTRPQVCLIAGMRRLPLPTHASSIPYQFRQTLLCYNSPSSSIPQQTWRLASRHDRSRTLSTSPVPGQAKARMSEVETDSSGSSPDQNDDRNSSQQPRDRTIPALPKLPFRFETGISLYAKRLPRPFPPPFLSPPSGSFSDPLSTHNRSRDRRPTVNGELIKGWTNGDDAVFASEYFIGANDGVGAWSARPRGHAG